MKTSSVRAGLHFWSDPVSFCLFARLRCDAGRCQDVWLVAILCVLASHGLEVLGETIAPIVAHKALTADTAGTGSTAAFVSRGGRTGVSWEYHPFLSCKSRAGATWSGSALDEQTCIEISLSLHPVGVTAPSIAGELRTTQNYELYACQFIANIVQFHVCDWVLTCPGPSVLTAMGK